MSLGRGGPCPKRQGPLRTSPLTSEREWGVMATRIECSQCGRDLEPHCRADNLCGWWRCPAPVKECDAKYFDLSRGILIHENGSRERLGSPD